MRVAWHDERDRDRRVGSLRAQLTPSIVDQLASAGLFTIETVGDARVMRLTQAPADATWLNYNRLFVERDGKVHHGYRDKLRIDTTLRLNSEAMNSIRCWCSCN